MAKLFNATIITRNGTVFQGKTSSLVAPGEIGYVGILANHAPFATMLVPGNITLRGDDDGKTTTFKSSGGGFLEVLRDEALILLDNVKPIEHL